jgi:hypothetical protein
MSNIPNVGDTVATSDGAVGAVWGVLQNESGVFVQFAAGGAWRAVAPVPAAEPAPAPAEPPTAEPVQ